MYPQDVAFPTTGVAHLTYHRDDVGFNFVYPGGDNIEVSAGGYNEPLSHLIEWNPSTVTRKVLTHSPYEEIVARFIDVCDNWCEQWPEDTGHGWFFGSEEQLVYVRPSMKPTLSIQGTSGHD